MGQYHRIINIDRREMLHAGEFGEGVKLYEHCSGDYGILTALHMLLACSVGRGGGDFAPNRFCGRWAGHRIAVVGDYAEDSDMPHVYKTSELYARRDLVNISEEVGNYMELLHPVIFLRFSHSYATKLLLHDIPSYKRTITRHGEEILVFGKTANSHATDIYWPKQAFKEKVQKLASPYEWNLPKRLNITLRHITLRKEPERPRLTKLVV